MSQIETETAGKGLKFTDPVEKTYLHLLPLDKEKIDIFLVFDRVYPLVTKWMDLFFQSNGWETDIHADFHQTELFRHFYFESKNIQKTQGEHRFAFGFPLVIEKNEIYRSKNTPASDGAISGEDAEAQGSGISKTYLTTGEGNAPQTPVARNPTKTYTVYSSDEPAALKEKKTDANMETVEMAVDPEPAHSVATEGLITAPLFIWYLSIKSHPTRKDSWIIGRDEAYPIVPNDYLIHFYKVKYNVDVKDQLYQFALQKSFGRDKLDVLCRDLGMGTRVGYTNAFLNAGLRECPNATALRNLKTTGDISWSGVLGLFPHQRAQNVLVHPVPLTVSEKILSDLAVQVKPVEPGHEFSLLAEDVYQKEAFRTSLRNKFSIIEGGHGTGKTHTAINLLLNALSNGQKTVVVAQDLATLMQIQNVLVGISVGNLSLLLKDLLFDQKLILNALRDETNAKTANFKQEEYKITLKQGRRLLIQSDARHKALNEGIFGDEPFSEVVGYYLQSRPFSGKEILSAYLSAKDYTFTKTEFAGLREATIQIQALFKKINTLRHPLGVLHPVIFLEKDKIEGKRFAAEKAGTFLEKFRTLQGRYMEVVDAYAQKLLSYYERHHATLSNQLNNLKDDFSDFIFQYGADFERNDFFKTGALTITSLFSQRSKQALQAKAEILKEYAELQRLFNDGKHFTHAFLSTGERKDFVKMQVNLDAFELALDAWRKRAPALMQEEMGRLNSKTSVFFDPGASGDIKELETFTDRQEQELNDSGLYETDVRHKTLTLLKRQLFVEEIIEQLEDTQNHLRDFDDFYDWRRYWLQLSPGGQKLIQSLIKVKPGNWTAAFESWYFYNILLKYYQSDAVHSDEPLRQLNEMEDKIRKFMPGQIAGLWHSRKEAAIQRLKREEPATYKLFYGPGKQKQANGIYLRDVVRSSIFTFTENYPVLLTTPQTYSQIFENNPAVVDLTIIEHGVPADLSTLHLAAGTGGRIVVIDENAGDEPDESSFFGLAKKAGAPSARLRYLHRNVSETTLKINQAVFYPDLQTPFTSKIAGQSVQIIHAAGRWNASSQTNEGEIQSLIKILEQIDATPFKTYPRIGVVCMTREQRNAFNAALLNIVQKTIFGWEKIAHLQRNGLTIFSIEEINGLQFDILIVSGVFDRMDQFPLTKDRLRAALNSFTKKLIWINSISKDRLAAARNDARKEVPYLLSSLLAAGEHISREQNEKARSVLQELEQRYTVDVEPKPSIFAGQIRGAISRWIESARVKEHYLINGYRFPLVVAGGEERPPIVIRVDGRFQPAKYFNADWDRKTLLELERLNIPVVSLWSYNWWKSPVKEAENLAYEIMTLQEKSSLPAGDGRRP